MRIDSLYRIRRISKQLILEMEQVSNTIFALGECYAGLYAAVTNFNKNTEIGKNLHLEDIYLTLNNMLVTWGKATTVPMTELLYSRADYDSDGEHSEAFLPLL